MKISEIFYSIQGETTSSGFPSLFIRLAGCNLQCTYCDTVYARAEGRDMPIEKIVETASRYTFMDHITITGGEPLLQKETITLIELLLKKNKVQLETNGSLLLDKVPENARRIIDIKTPSSGHAESFILENLKYINPCDEIKFVISDINDYNYSKTFIMKNLMKSNAIINFSPVMNKFPAKKLAELILTDRLKVRLNLQMHKFIWPDGEPNHF